MKIGIYGGTFNPVHKGHLNCLLSVIDSVSLDKIMVLPDRIPPHKSAAGLAKGRDRLNMCRLAFGSLNGVVVSDWELKQKGKSYTVQTLRYFKKENPDDELFLIIGSDMLLSFEKWFKYDEILHMATLLCVSRDDEDTEELLRLHAKKLVNEFGGNIKIVKTIPLEVSSTQIRKMIADNKDCSCYLDENVVKYIKNNKLYGLK